LSRPPFLSRDRTPTNVLSSAQKLLQFASQMDTLFVTVFRTLYGCHLIGSNANNMMHYLCNTKYYGDVFYVRSCALACKKIWFNALN
jgi:hypothetical protein